MKRLGRAFLMVTAALRLLAAEATNHWSLLPLVRPALPAGTHSARNPVDQFIQAKLVAAQLAPSPEADRSTLLRRVTFDLTGLPPTPVELRDFLDDPSTNAYGRVVDRLLESPRYGERWARHWMDAAHFAETHGHDQDRIRTNAWPYRDYLINAFNADKPYARFVQEQVAGDMLFPDDPQATVALGFVAAGPWDESSLRDIREDTLDRQIGRYLDRDDMIATVMSVVTSTTVHCARCHDHKFDPIPQRDYYALQAVFAGVERANRVYDNDPQVHRRRQELMHKRRRVDRGETNLLNSAETRLEVAAWHAHNLASPVRWHTLAAQTFVSMGGANLVRQTDGSVLATGPRPERDTYTITVPAPDFPLTAVQLEVLPDDSLPKHGPGRQEQNGNLHLSELQLLLFEPGTNAPRRLALVNPTADFNQEGWTIAHAIDGNEKTAWGIHPQEGKPHRAAFELKEPLRVPAGSTLAFVLQQLHGEGHLIGRFRLSLTDTPTPVRILPAEIEQLAGTPIEQLNEAQWRSLATFALREQTGDELAALPEPFRVYAAAGDFEPDASLRPSLEPRTVHRLKRGEITQPLEAAGPGALACVTALPSRFAVDERAEEGARRAELARWLTARDNPLTWRSIVNRVWHHHFGRGLVETPNDFGKLGSAPSHPELLDWLAVWFRDEAHGSFKELHRLIVMSATYRQGSQYSVASHQSSAKAADASAKLTIDHWSLNTSSDSDNRLLSRMNRTRLDAECVRDAILLASGRLDLRMGGPSDRQFDLQPGIHVTPHVDYTKFDPDSVEGGRRSVYRFLFRTLPDPFMEALDCPAGDQLVATRNNSVTVQQALALWNDAFVARHAEHFAARLTRLHDRRASRINVACKCVWGRPPTAQESEELTAYADEHGLANLCRLLFNSNEFMFVN
jgi:hypothetical protein